MSTSEDLWEEGERQWYAAADRVADKVCEQVDAAVLYELALKAHESAGLEVERSLAAVHAAVRRLHRARRHSRRAGLTLWRAMRLVVMRKAGNLGEMFEKELARER